MLTLSTAFSAEQTFAPPSDESYRLGWWLNVDNLWRISEENYSYKCMGSKHPWLIFYILKKKENRRNYTANIISVFFFFTTTYHWYNDFIFSCKEVFFILQVSSSFLYHILCAFSHASLVLFVFVRVWSG